MLECALVRQDSLSECVPNVTFGCEPRLGARVWVTGGCRGWFTCGGSQVHCDGPAGTSCPCAASPALAQRGSSLLHMLPPPPAQFNRSRLHAMQCCQTNGAVAIDRATVNATLGPVTSLASCVTVCTHVRLCRFVSFTAPTACQLCLRHKKFNNIRNARGGTHLNCNGGILKRRDVAGAGDGKQGKCLKIQ